MTPTYIPNFVKLPEGALESVTWEDRVNARRECFMSAETRAYVYGSGRGVRTYTSTPMLEWVADIMARMPGSPNVCFLNRYEGERNALGWHSDDSPDTASSDPISVVSFGEPREIWWRKRGDTGIVPESNRKLLEPGALFVMPPGFQEEYEHRIPKGSRKMGARTSLTYRRMLDKSLIL